MIEDVVAKKWETELNYSNQYFGWIHKSQILYRFCQLQMLVEKSDFKLELVAHFSGWKVK